MVQWPVHVGLPALLQISVALGKFKLSAGIHFCKTSTTSSPTFIEFAQYFELLFIHIEIL